MFDDDLKLLIEAYGTLKRGDDNDAELAQRIKSAADRAIKDSGKYAFHSLLGALTVLLQYHVGPQSGDALSQAIKDIRDHIKNIRNSAI